MIIIKIAARDAIITMAEGEFDVLKRKKGVEGKKNEVEGGLRDCPSPVPFLPNKEKQKLIENTIKEAEIYLKIIIKRVVQ